MEARSSNLLVSAAAGSGKTAVLVERILSLLTEENAPLDIDRLLIVTFTNAAASEMRERIGQRIEEYMEHMPENEHLQRQLTLVHTAPITTIDSFCMRVLKEHFDETELDPSFRIGDEGEQRLMRSSVAEELLEDYYREGSPEFFHFVESYSTGKSDAGLEALIERLYEFSMSYPEPEQWLASALRQYEVSSMEEWEQTEAAGFLRDYGKRMAEDMIRRLKRAAEVSREPDGPVMYLDALESDLGQLAALAGAGSYREYEAALGELSFVRLSSKKSVEVSPEKRERVKAVRDSVKKVCKELLKQFYGKTEEELLADMQAAREPVRMLLRLTAEFGRRYAEKKREKNVIDFHDVEHFALGLLAEKPAEGGWSPTGTAAEYREQFAEIMIDEYQDSNLVQEIILTSISGVPEGRPNIFMVGDVKQSIYKFRQARPELFMEKHDSYCVGEGAYRRIDLHKNFRSRSQVLDSVNEVFERIMTRELGGITYDEVEALFAGAGFEPKPGASGEQAGEEPDENKTELYLIEKKTESGEAAGLTAGELEAKVVAGRIRELTGENGLLVWDKERKIYRRACCRDIVILLRSVSSYAESFVSVLSEEGIPAYAQSQSGYFTAAEVQTVLNYLRIVDNPRQDIPLAGVLKSVLGGFSARELALLRAEFPEGSLWDSLEACVRAEESGVPADRFAAFYSELNRMRDMASYTPIHELIRLIIRETGFGDSVMAMPSGQKRRLNLDMLIEKAYAFEATSYRGLFQFLRYVERLERYEVDYGEAPEAGENDDAVRIMSIHKSKGLEFPVVFLCGLGRRFNQQDVTEKLVLHPDMGVGADRVDYKRRTRSVTLVKRALQRSIRLENLAEELRVLYVAMTRAREKLILTGASADAEKSLMGWEQEAAAEGTLAYGVLTGAASYLDWIVPACRSLKADRMAESAVEIAVIRVPEVVEAEASRQQEQQDSYRLLSQWDSARVYDLQTREELEEHFSYAYPYAADVALHGKISVSELKRRSLQPEEEPAEALIPEEPPLLPEFIQGGRARGGAARGTLYHRVLEHLKLQETESREAIERQLEEMEEKKQLNAEERSQINTWKLWRFFNGEAGRRMRRAQKEGRLVREQPFVIGRRADEFYPDTDSGEMILLQGIIDVYFEEEGELVLLDYKTDYTEETPEGEERLRSRYQVQFDCYRQALEQITGKTVKEMLLYSFALNREIPMQMKTR